jgi:hypothetical protein
MKKTGYLFVLCVFFCFSGCKQAQKTEQTAKDTTVTQSVPQPEVPNTLTDAEKTEGWQLLFDGKTSTGWRGYNKKTFPEKGWEVVDGSLHCIGSGTGEAGNGGDVISEQKYKDFEFSLEWKISKGGNSGIFILAQEKAKQPIWKSAPEMQILDNDNHPDAKLGENGNRKAGSLYDLIPANPQNAKPVGEWNKVRILVYQGTVVFYQNDAKVLEFHLWTQDWDDMINKSKFKGWEDFINTGGPDKKGYLGLQDHGNDVWFRNIKIKVM